MSQECSSVTGGSIKWLNQYEKIFQYLYSMNQQFFTSNILKRNDYLGLQIYLYKKVNERFFKNVPNQKQSKCPSAEDYNKILLNNQKKRYAYTYINLEEFQTYYVKWKKWDEKVYILYTYNCIYAKFKGRQN